MAGKRRKTPGSMAWAAREVVDNNKKPETVAKEFSTQVKPGEVVIWGQDYKKLGPKAFKDKYKSLKKATKKATVTRDTVRVCSPVTISSSTGNAPLTVYWPSPSRWTSAVPRRMTGKNRRS